MVKGTAKISKQIFWISKKNNEYSFNSKKEDIENGKMAYLPDFKIRRHEVLKLLSFNFHF